MDPLAHTLFGATLAEAGLKKKTALATGTLIIGANLPDIDAIAMFWSTDYALLVRRGWTHGILAMAIWPLLLTGAMLLFDRFWRSRYLRSIGHGRWPGPPVKAGSLFFIAFLGVLSHPLLDLLNTYGVRLLMPFSEEWFYGDILFIVDPWMWLLTGAAVVLARSESYIGAAGWIILGIATTAIVTGAAVAPLSAKIFWCVGVALIILIRRVGWFSGRVQYVAAGCLAVFGIYLVIMFIGAKMTVFHAKGQLISQGVEVQQVMADPQPARVLLRGGVAVSDTHYYRFRVNWLNGDSFEVRGNPISFEEPGPVVEAALRSPDVQGLLNWIRFPYYEVQSLNDGWRVIIRDLRYVSPGEEQITGIGMAVVDLDEELNLR